MERHKSARYHMLWYNDGLVPTTYPGPTRSPGAGSHGDFRVNIEYLKFELVLVDWGTLGGVDARDEGSGRGSGAGA